MKTNCYPNTFLQQKPKTEDGDLKKISLEELLFKHSGRSLNGSYNAQRGDAFVEKILNTDMLNKRIQELNLSVLNETISSTTPIGQDVKRSVGKYWFFKDGTVWPTRGNASGKKKIWPHEDPEYDRIVPQLMHIPDNYDPNAIKTVLLTNAGGAWNVPMGPNVFQECPVKACTISSDSNLIKTADALIFRDYVNIPSKPIRKQVSPISIFFYLLGM